jgi:hypothetical protein
VTLFGLARSPAVLLAVGTALVVITLYTVRFRLPRRLVGTTMLWRQVLSRTRGTGRLGRLDSLVSLLVQLTIAAGLLAAAAAPRFACQRAAGRSAVVVLDRSTSMATIEKVETRLARAKRIVARRVDELARIDRVGVVLAGGETELAAPLARDHQGATDAIERAEIHAGAGTLAEAVALGCRELAGAEQPALIVASDSSERFDPCPGAELELVSVGAAHPNVGVTAFEAAIAPRDPHHAEAFVEVENASASRAKVELRLDLDGALLHVAELDLAPQSSERRTFDDVPLSGTRLLARLARIEIADGKDGLADDDVAYALVPHRQVVPVDLVGADPVLRMVLAANPRYKVTERAKPEPDAVAVISGPLASPLGPGRYLLVDPSGPGAPVKVGGAIAGPHFTYWRDEHPVMRRVVLSDVMVGEARRLDLPATATALAGDEGAPLVFALEDGPVRAVGIGFDLASSDLPLRVGFPVLVYNALDWLAGSAAEAPRTAGGPVELAAAAAIELRAPGERPRQLTPEGGRVRFVPVRAGYYELGPPGGPATVVALSVAARGETELSPLAALPPPSGTPTRLRDRDPWTWFALFALALLLIEWTTYHRRLTV